MDRRARNNTNMLVAFAASLALVLPPGWHVVHPALLEPCTNPAPRLAVARGKNLVLVEESLDAPRYIARFTPRPRRFHVRGPASFLACCAAARAGKGWQLDFRDHGRGFYAYVYGDPRTALPVLDSLRVKSR
jgi:hypothetical protein